MFWKLAKVEELLPSSDGVVRSAKVRVNGEGGEPITLRRPIQHLIPLEVKPTAREETFVMVVVKKKTFVILVVRINPTQRN